MLVREILGRKSTPGDVGIEIEVEAARGLPVEVPSPWVAKAEGSLRGNSMEYITKKPIFCDDKKLAHLQRLMTVLSPSQPIQDNVRTSVHVHCNILEHTLAQLYTTVCAYWLVDNLMVKYCGPDREGCNFCLRIKDAEHLIKQVNDSLSVDNPFKGLGNNIRYSSQNLSSISEHGSLEYRSMRGTLDPVLIDKWSTALHTMVQATKMYQTPDNLMDTIYDTDYRLFLNHMFGIPFAEELRAIEGYKDLIDENIGIVAEVAYCHNWVAWEQRMEARYGKKDDAQIMFNHAVQAGLMEQAQLFGDPPILVNAVGGGADAAGWVERWDARQDNAPADARAAELHRIARRINVR